MEDSPWKADWAHKILSNAGVEPKSICEVGCGAGAILAEMRNMYHQAEIYGFDIAPGVVEFWQRYSKANIKFQLGDFFVLNNLTYDVVLLLDVIEHVPNPFDFLVNLKGVAKYYLFHFPLDLSASTIIREKPILNVREKVGHINYFTKNLALKLVQECGYTILNYHYSEASLKMQNRKLRTILASFPRRIFYSINKDLGVRILGGETLYILAKD